MIQTDFNFAEPLSLLLIIVALATIMLQCGLLYARHRHSGRLTVRLGLNGLLWISMVAWMLDPSYTSVGESNVGLLVAENMPRDIVDRLRDSLPGARMIAFDEVRNAHIDTLVIAGQRFDPKIFAAVRRSQRISKLHWIPWFAPDQISDLQWKGVITKGALQRIDGRIQSSRKQPLRVQYAGQTLDSLMLGEEDARFRLAFPAFSEGRVAVTLHLGDQTIDTLRFFTQPEEKLAVRFILDNPDFETRNLATWLGKQGYAVLYDTGLSKNIRSNLNINRATAPGLIITTASNAANATVKKAVSDGKSVFFLQPASLPDDLRAINSAFGTRFQATKVSNDESVAVSSTLTGLPYRFEPHDFQSIAAHYPVAVEKTTGKIGVSLLNETFPLQLSGDSIAYGKVWNEILAYMRPARSSMIEWDAPVAADVPVTMRLNSIQPVPSFLTPGADTAFTDVSALNERSAVATFMPGQRGWLALHDSLETEMYVEGNSPLQDAAQMQYFIQSNRGYFSGNEVNSAMLASRKLPGWVWFTWLILCFAAVWIEPKL